MMQLRQIAELNQQRYERPKYLLDKWLEERGLERQYEIFIYPEYPDDWEAVTVIIERIWIFRCERGKIWIRDIQHLQGVRPNGALIFS